MEPINPSNPLIVPFLVTNAGPFKLYDVSFSCNLRHFEYERNSVINGPTAEWNATTPTMRVGEQTTGQCFSFIKVEAKLVKGDLTIEIGFKNSWWKRRKTRTFRFITWTDNEGKLVWRPKARDEPEFVQEK